MKKVLKVIGRIVGGYFIFESVIVHLTYSGRVLNEIYKRTDNPDLNDALNIMADTFTDDLNGFVKCYFPGKH